MVHAPAHLQRCVSLHEASKAVWALLGTTCWLALEVGDAMAPVHSTLVSGPAPPLPSAAWNSFELNSFEQPVAP
jgi:hypothetical protein